MAGNPGCHDRRDGPVGESPHFPLGEVTDGVDLRRCVNAMREVPPAPLHVAVAGLVHGALETTMASLMEELEAEGEPPQASSPGDEPKPTRPGEEGSGASEEVKPRSCLSAQ